MSGAGSPPPLRQRGPEGQRIRLGLVAGPEPEAASALAVVLAHLEADWFAVDVLAAHDPPEPWAQWAGQGRWTRVPWRAGWRGVGRVRAIAAQWAADLDVCAVWGFSALAAAPPHPVLVYARTAELVRGEPALARRAVAVVDAAPPGRERGRSDPRATRVNLAAPAEAVAPSRAPRGTRLLLWAGAGAAPELLADARAVAAQRGLALELVEDVGSNRWTEAQVAVLPLAEARGPSVLDAALASGAAVVATRIPGVVGRVRCPVEALLVDGADRSGWRETVDALLADEEWQRTLSRGADDWRRRAGAAGQVRILQGVFAGALAVATGRCPLCPPSAVHGTPD